MARMEFSGPSYIRFHERLQRDRALIYSLSYLIVLFLRSVGQVDFDAFGLFLTVMAANLSALCFGLLYHHGFEDRWGIKFYPAWMAIDVVVITFCIYMSGDPYGLWFMWYLVNTAGAAFSQGARAAFWVGASNCLAYVVVYLIMAEPGSWASGLPPILGRLLMLYGLSFFLLRGISDLRRRRLIIKSLMAEKTQQVEELTRMTRALNDRNEEIKRANERIQEANRMKSRFLANMSHELRTPLNSIIGFSDVVLNRAHDRLNEREMKFLGNIHSSGEHLLGLVNDLLDLSKIEAGKMELMLEEADLGNVVGAVKNVMEALAVKRGVRIEIRIPDDLPRLVADVPKLKQILYNLLSNAVKFSPRGGRIDLAARELDATESSFGRAAIEISIVDEGPGIPPEHLSRIFDEFYQVETDASQQETGTGLGLALVSKLCELHGGTIVAESVVGKGSTFRATIPLEGAAIDQEEAGEVEPKPAPPGQEAPESRPVVLIVEDDMEDFNTLAGELESAGFLPVRARHGEEALRLAAELRPAAMTLDLVIPGIDGWDVLTAIKGDGATSGIPVVIVSTLDNRELGMTLGADDYFTKPIDRDRFLERLRELVKPRRSREHPTRILLIDDDPLVHQILSESLPADEFELVGAGNGKEGLEIARQDRFGAIVLDLLMPEMNGFEVGEALKQDERTRDIPVIVLTAHSLSSMERDRLSGTVTSILEKEPEQSRRLVDVLRRLQAGGR